MNPNKRFNVKLKGGRCEKVKRIDRCRFDFVHGVYTSLDGQLNKQFLMDILDGLAIDSVFLEYTPNGTLFQVRRKKDREENGSQLPLTRK